MAKGKEEQIQIFAVDDGGGDILEKERVEEMQVIAVDDGGKIVAKGKEEQIQIFAVDDGGGGELAGNILYRLIVNVAS